MDNFMLLPDLNVSSMVAPDRTVSDMNVSHMNVSHMNVSDINATGMQVEEIPLEVQVRDTLYFKIAMALHFYYLPVIVVVGLVGNSLTLAVMLQKRYRKVSACFYMAHLASSDNLVLLYGAFTWVDAMFQLIPKTDLSCGLSNLFLGLVSNYNIMILVALAFDRFMAIRFPLQSPVLCTVKRAKWTLLVLGTLSTALTIPVAFTATSPDGRVCAAHSAGSLLDQVHSALSLILFSILPFVLLLCMNVAIITVILGRRKKLERYRDMQEGPAAANNGKDGNDEATVKKTSTASTRDVQLAVMLIAVTFVFLLLILPLNLRYILGSVYDYKSSLDAFAAYYIILVVSAKTHITNSGVNFFLYCLSGSTFRADVFRILRCEEYHKNKTTMRSSMKNVQQRSSMKEGAMSKSAPINTSLSTVSPSVADVSISTHGK